MTAEYVMNAAFETVSAVAVRHGIPAVAVITLIVAATVIIITVIVVIAVVAIVIVTVVIVVTVVAVIVAIIIVIAAASFITLFAPYLSSFLTLMIFERVPLGSPVVILGICRDIRAKQKRDADDSEAEDVSQIVCPLFHKNYSP